MTLKVAFYKADGNVYNGLIRWWDSGMYSHCELVFNNGMSVSASYSDGKRVRSKWIEYKPERWDFIEVPDHLAADALKFFQATDGMKYDLIGQARFIVAPFQGTNNKYWCSEWVADALGMKDAWRYGPNGLHAALTACLAFKPK